MDGRGRWVADAGLGLGFAVTLVVQTVALQTSWGTGSWWLGCVVAVLVCGLALVRGRQRTATAVAGLAVAAVAVVVARFAGLPSEPSPATAAGMAVLVGSAVRVLRVPVAVATAAGGCVVVAGSLWLDPGSAVPALAAVGWFAGVVVGLVLQLVDAQRRAAVETVRRDERLALARELHDVVAHHVTGVVLAAQAARIAARRRPERVDASLAEIEDAGADALAAMRRVVGLLRDNDDAPPATAGSERLDELVERFGGHGPAVELRLTDDTAAWPDEVTSTVYRVVQEALTNVARHAARATAVTVDVARDGTFVAVDVVDDAPQPRARPHPGGYGLVGMRERVEALGGTLRAGPGPGGGWCVRARLPVAGTVTR